MSASNSPLNQAHAHAINAEDYSSRGLLILAAEEHYKAAEAFQASSENCSDDNTKRTLRMLFTDHSKAGKDLQRKIAKLKEEGKDPHLPHLPTSSRAVPSGHVVDSGRHTLTPSSPHGRMLDSPSNTVDESFMVLHQQTEHSDDPFDMFWKVTGDMMINLSQPIGFPTAALAALEAVGTSAATDHVANTRNDKDSDLRPGPSRRVKPLETSSALNARKEKPGSSVYIPSHDDDPDEDYDSSDSFCLVPSSSEASSSAAKLRKENSALKSQLETMQKQVASVHKQMTLRMEQDQQLRDHIMIARKEAQRAMAASTSLAPRSGQSMMDLGALNINLPAPPATQAVQALNGGRDRESQLLRRIRELEEESRVMRVENEKQKAMIDKFRERWEKLKESAKRKRSAKAAAQADISSVRERIDEDPEAEEAAEESSRDGA